MIRNHLPAIQVVIPLVAAPICVLLHRPRVVWAFATLVSWIVFGVALLLLERVWSDGTISYPLGGWAAPWGIEYRIDFLNALVLIIVASVNAIVLLFAGRSVEQEIQNRRAYLFYACWLLCVTGLLGITITGDAFNLFVFLEISSLASYALISFSSDRRGLLAAYRYLVLGTIAATFILIGIGFLYAMTGTLNMADLAERVPQVSHTRTVVVAFAFLTVGISLKVALFPLHMWLPNAYTHAPSAVSALLAATATKVGVYVGLRFLFTVLGGGFSFEAMELDRLLLLLALVATVAGSVIAVFQDNLKRMLAYSSVAQIGYMVLGISFATQTGLTGGIVHLLNHAVTKAALFMALGCVLFRVGSVTLADYAGMGRRMPWTMAAFVAGGLSLIGVPLTVGFISKWYLVLAALEKGWWPVALLVLISSLIAVVYVWRVVEVVYFRDAAVVSSKPAGDDVVRREEAPLSMLIPTWVLVGSTIYFGVHATLTTEVARRAAGSLLGVAP